MLDKVKSYVKKWQMLESEDCVIVGLSGGADSVCLLFVLLELQKEMNFRMVAVHVNHQLRGDEANADEEYARTLCECQGLPFESYSVDVELFAKNRKQSTEEAGRYVRMECFEKTMEKYGGTKIALAHHSNDNAETFFLNLARGTGLKGLGGIRPISGEVIRPLLCVNRAEIEAYLKEQSIAFCVDRTNASDAYTRNRIRNHVIPYLEEQVNEKTLEHMSETMEQLRQVQEFMELQTIAYEDICVREIADGLLILQDEYEHVPQPIDSYLIRQVLADVAEREKDLEAIHVKQVAELFGKQTGRKIDLPYHMEAKRVYDGVEVVCKKQITEEQDEKSFSPSEGDTRFSWKEMEISCRVLQEIEETEKSHTKCFDCDIIENNLTFRTRRPGDYITIHSDGRTQKLKSYFINEKIPRGKRDQILLVADGSHILWIVGYRVNPIYKATEQTKAILEIKIDKGEDK